MKKILFLIHDLGPGGAEKVLVNLVNNMDREQFDVTVIALFGGGVNERFLAEHIHYRAVFPKEFPGNSRLMKLFSPKWLHKKIVKEHYDIEVSYLEGPAARVISGCDDAGTKLVSWIHVEQHTQEIAAQAFRSYEESVACYTRFDRTVCVSEYVKQDFLSIYPMLDNVGVLYNTNESQKIVEASKEDVDDAFEDGVTHLVGVGKLMPNKGFDRLLRITKRLRDADYPVCLHILGVGPKQQELEQFIKENGLENAAVLHGYQTNPYKYVAKSDLFVCASFAEGFSTAATEALIVGTPVCTVDVSGMKEMLGENNEYGIVTENDEDALYNGIKRLLDDPTLLKHYTEQAVVRGKDFSTEKTVKAVEDMLEAL